MWTRNTKGSGIDVANLVMALTFWVAVCGVQILGALGEFLGISHVILYAPLLMPMFLSCGIVPGILAARMLIRKVDAYRMRRQRSYERARDEEERARIAILATGRNLLHAVSERIHPSSLQMSRSSDLEEALLPRANGSDDVGREYDIEDGDINVLKSAEERWDEWIARCNFASSHSQLIAALQELRDVARENNTRTEERAD